MNARRWVLLAILLAAFPGEALATGDLYVSPGGSDANPGTQAAPFRTIAKAATSSALVPGTTVHVAPGTYSEQVVSRTNGTPTDRVRFVSDTTWGAKIQTSGVNPSWHQYGDYTDIVGFDVSGDSFIGIENEAVNNVRVMGNHVHHITGPACINQSGGAGIAISAYAGRDHETTGNLVHDVDDGSPGSCELTHGIYHMNAGGRVSNNTVYHNKGWGVETWHWATGLTISNNLSFDNGSGGIIVGAPFSEGGSLPQPPGADNFVVANNIVVNNRGESGRSGGGIQEAGFTGSNNVYRDNVVAGNVNGDIALQHGLAATGTVSADPRELLVIWRPDGTGPLDDDLDAQLRCTLRYGPDGVLKGLSCA